MTFDETLTQILELLQRDGRVSYRALKRRFALDEDYLDDLKAEIIQAKRLAVDEDGAVLVWTGGAIPAPVLASAPARAPLTYTPAHLAEKIRAARPALEGERKQVTVLFADLKGSTELIAGLDPEAAQTLLDPALHVMMDAVHRYEGTVNQVLGDGIMALFGAPVAHEDHAVRACYAALAMQAALRRYADEVQRAHGLVLQMRVGLNAGDVVVRAIGNDLHMDYSAVGQTTHLAARMEQLARPGAVLITPAVHRLVEGYVQVKPLGPMPIKGLRDPLEVYEVLGAGPVRTRLQAAVARGLTPFVGRQTEVAALHQALEQARLGHGQVVAVLGEPGVGKSRLFWEFPQSPHVHGWRVLAYGTATPYLPVIDLLTTYFQIEAGDDMRQRRAKITSALLTLDRALESSLPAFLALLDVSVDDPQWQALEPTQRRQHTLEAWTYLLLRESQVQPVLMVVEDLHWSDAETQACLDHLVERLPAAGLLLLVNYRPEYQHQWGQKTCYTQLRLAPLPAVSAAEILRALLGDDASLEPLTRLLIDRTEGNPFFLEESVRTLVETGALVGAPGAYRLAQGLPTIQVPATVQAVLAARMDRLPPETKRLLQTAAVIGTEVPVPLLQAIAELSEDAAQRGLAHLQAAEFLYETRLFPEREYTFKHALTHEVAYGSLLQARQRILHARVVDALEVLSPDRLAEVASGRSPDQVERLAHHALRGEVWDKAVTYCQQAGARAYDRAAFREAMAYSDQALQALVQLPEDGDTRVLAIDLRLALGGPLHALGEHGRRLTLLGEAEALARALDDRVRLGWVLAEMANVLRMTGDHDGAMAAGQQALALATALGESALQARASFFLAQTYYAIGDFGRAAELQRWNVEAADRESGTPNTDERSLSRAWLARTLSALGAFAEGRRHGEEALHLATMEGRGQMPVIAHGSLGTLYLDQGDLEHAIRVFDQGLALCRASGNRTWLRVISAGLGYASALQGRLAEGRALLEEGISESIRTGALGHHSGRVAWLSEVCRLAGYGDAAWQHARQALDLARHHKERGNEAFALYQLGVVYAHVDPPDALQAEVHYQQALALAEELGMRPLQAHCHRGLGTLYGTSGRREEARAETSTAIEMYRAMEMTFWFPAAEAALAQVIASASPASGSS